MIEKIAIVWCDHLSIDDVIYGLESEQMIAIPVHYYERISTNVFQVA